MIQYAGCLWVVFSSLITVFTLYHLLRNQKAPADESNRFNAARLWWFALTREDKFAEALFLKVDEDGTEYYEPAFPWVRNDEWDNIK